LTNTWPAATGQTGAFGYQTASLSHIVEPVGLSWTFGEMLRSPKSSYARRR
jgi:hypothetical protein